MNDRTRRRAFLLLIAIGITAFTLGCSLGQMVVQVNTPTPPPTKTLRPTFTPTTPPTATPIPTDTPVPTSTPTNTVVPTETIVPIPTDTPTPADTPTPVPTDTPTTPPLPSAVTNADNLNLRAGPGTNYASLGKLRLGTQLEVRMRLPDNSWLRVCCFEGQEGWSYAQFLDVTGSLDNVPVDASAPPTATRGPTNTPRPPTNTPVPEPSYRFALQSREDFATGNQFLDIGVRIFNGEKGNFLPGFRVKLIDTTHGKEFLSKPSTTSFYWTDFEGSGAAKMANVNFDQIPVIGDSNWVLYVTDDGGNRLSADVSFALSTANRRKFYFLFVGK